MPRDLKKSAHTGPRHDVPVEIVPIAGEQTDLTLQLLNFSPDGIVGFDHALRYTFWNPAMVRITGKSAEDVLGRVASEVFPFQRENGTTDAKVRALKGEVVLRQEQPFTVPETERGGYYEASYAPVKDASGAITGGMAIIRDTTEQRSATLAARQHFDETIAHHERNDRVQLRLIAELFQFVPGALCFTNSDKRFQFVNQAFADLFGLPIAAFIGRTFEEIFHEGAGSEFAEVVAKVETGKPFSAFSFPFLLPSPQGPRESYWDFTLTPVVEEKGTVIGVLSLGFEVTRRVQLEQELARQRQLSERIISHVPAGIAYLDKDFVYRWCNPPALDFFCKVALSPDQDVIGRSLFEVYPDAPPVRGMFEEAARTGELLSGTATPYVTHHAGRDVTTYWDYVCTPIMREGQFDGMLIMNIEVTERVERERLQREQLEQMREIERLKSDFLNAASHELRTPLTAIKGYAEFLEDQVGGSLTPQQQGFVMQIQTGAQRLEHIVEDLLDFARMEAGTFQISPQNADLARLVRDTAEMLRPLAQEARLKLVDEAPHSPLWVRMDPLRVGQVLTNLIGNAIKFTPPQGRVTLRIEATDDCVRVEVADTGVGIAPEQQPRVFDKFYQVDPSITRARGGAGLGLSIAKALVEAHRGAIGLSSEHGRGTVFWFTLPRAADPGKS